MPFSSVPDVALARIFSFMVDVEKNDKYRFYTHRQGVPLPIQLSHISSDVRRVVKNTSALWRYLDAAVLGQQEVLDTFLVRSSNDLLEIQIGEYLGTHAIRNFYKVIAHINRWHRLDISAETVDVFMMLITPLRALCAVRLEYLKLSYIGDQTFGEVSPGGFLLSGGTPALKSLHLYSVACFPSTLENLTHFEFHNGGYSPLLPYSLFCQRLASMRSLASLYLIGQTVTVPRMREVLPILLPSLTSFTITPAEDYDAHINIPAACVSAVCATVVAPGLQRMAFDELTLEILTPFLKQLRKKTFRFPLVKCLMWSTALDDPEDAVIIMRSFPMVEHITLHDFEGDIILETLLRYDRDPHSDNRLWTHLQTVTVVWVNVRILRELVSARVGFEEPIRTVRIHKGMLRGEERKTEDMVWLREHVRLKFVSDDNIREVASDWTRD